MEDFECEQAQPPPTISLNFTSKKKKSKKKKNDKRLTKTHTVLQWVKNAYYACFATGLLDARVMEIKCGEPGCPPLELVVLLVKMDNSSEQIRVKNSLMETQQGDVEAVMRVLKEGGEDQAQHTQNASVEFASVNIKKVSRTPVAQTVQSRAPPRKANWRQRAQQEMEEFELENLY